MLVDLDEVVRIATLAIEFDWTWSVDDLERLAAATEVAVADYRGKGLRGEVSGLMASIGLYPSSDGSGAERRVEYVTLLVAQGESMPAAVAREFTELAARIASRLGPANRQRRGDLAEFGWERDTVVIALQQDSHSIALDMVDPRYQERVDSRSADRIERAVRSTDWERFTTALHRTLGRLTADSYLILSTSGNRFAQFAMSHEELWSQIVSNKYLDDGFRMSAADHDTMIRIGWDEPSEYGNWDYQTDDPSNCRDVAERVTLALRDVLRIDMPTELMIRAWIDTSRRQLDISEFLTA